MIHTSPQSLVSQGDTTDKKIKKSLLKTLSKKRKQLLLAGSKVEMLKMDLDIIKREYHVRIGRLYLKDDQLDLEILRYKRIKSMVEEGVSYDDAVKKINEQYYEDKKVFDFRDEEIKEDEAFFAKRKIIEPTTQEDMKKLWKKLLFQLHPDLTKNPEEKKQREAIMRKINEAYAENDFDTLKSIENQHMVENIENTSIERLEQRIVDIEEALITLELEYKQLRISEWFVWRKKSLAAKKKNIDIFKDLEEHLLEDVARKIKIVQMYRKEFDEKGYY